MEAPKIPKNEQKRLEMLHSLDILDTTEEERFDRLTRIAMHMFNVPIAIVSLVAENRQWFKSCMGLKVKDVPREQTFCGHAILDSELLIIPDTTQDKRFFDNPLVLEDPHVRFYVGCPLTVNGYRIGTLCIVDQKPRTFSAKDAELIRDLAAIVESELNATQQAKHDELTGLLNRRGFLSLAKHNVKLALTSHTPISFVYLDLDYFKAINDNFGHPAGDDVLITFASQLSEQLQPSDTLSRLSGDEYVLLLNNTNASAAATLIKAFQASIHTYYQTQNSALNVSFSFGVVEFDEHQHHSVEAIIAEADKKMYENKRHKKASNSYCFTPTDVNHADFTDGGELY